MNENDDPKIKPSPNRRSRESAMMVPDLDYFRQRQAEMRDPNREARYRPGFKLEPTKKESPVAYVEWNVQDIATEELLVPVGGEESARERLADLEAKSPGQYRLVSRTIGDWEPVAEPCAAKLHHGPGHQSTTHCRLTGKHDVHEAVYDGDQFAAWTSDEAMTGFMDEPPVMDDLGPSA